MQTQTTTGAGTGAAGSATTPGNTAAAWTDALSPENKAFVQEQGIKEPGALIESYQNLRKHLGAGADKLLRTPDSYTDPKEQEAAWNTIYDRLGRPKAPSEYGIENKDDAENTKFLAETFHKNGLTKSQAENLAKSFTERQAGLQKSAIENQQNLAKQSVEKLKMEWGGTYEQNMRLAQAGQKALGFDDKMVDQIASVRGVGETIKMLNDIGRRVGESTYVASGKGPEINTPDTAKQKISQLMTDKSFVDKLMAGDAVAKSQWSKLHEEMAEGRFYS
jgi:hypothetical protein